MMTNQKVLWGLGGTLLVLVLVAVFSGGGMGGVGTMMGGGMMGGGTGGMFFMLFAWSLVIAFFVTLFTWGTNQSQRQ